MTEKSDYTPSKSVQQTLGSLAVDNIKLSERGLELLHAVDRGDMTHDEAIEDIKQRAFAMSNKPDDYSRAERNFMVRNANASSALEGIPLDENVADLQQRYIDGEFANAEILGEHVQAYLRKKYNLPPKPTKFKADVTLDLLAVDDLYPSKAGLELFEKIDRGEMTIEEAKEQVKIRARKYGAGGQ